MSSVCMKCVRCKVVKSINLAQICVVFSTGAGVCGGDTWDCQRGECSNTAADTAQYPGGCGQNRRIKVVNLTKQSVGSSFICLCTFICLIVKNIRFNNQEGVIDLTLLTQFTCL